MFFEVEARSTGGGTDSAPASSVVEHGHKRRLRTGSQRSCFINPIGPLRNAILGNPVSPEDLKRSPLKMWWQSEVKLKLKRKAQRIEIATQLMRAMMDRQFRRDKSFDPLKVTPGALTILAIDDLCEALEERSSTVPVIGFYPYLKERLQQCKQSILSTTDHNRTFLSQTWAIVELINEATQMSSLGALVYLHEPENKEIMPDGETRAQIDAFFNMLPEEDQKYRETAEPPGSLPYIH